MSKLFRFSTVSIVAIVAGVIIALFAFLYPTYDGRAKDLEGQEIFLNDKVLIHSKYDLNTFEQGHPIGEPFFFIIKVQYRHKKIELLVESLENAVFDPFEKTGNESIDIRQIDEEISQMTYSVELIAIQAIPGEFYYFKKIPLEYRDIEMGIVKISNISTTQQLHVGKRLADSLEKATLNPPKGLLSENSLQKTLAYFVAAFILFIPVGIIVISWIHSHIKEKRNDEEEVSYLSAIKKIKEEISLFKDIDWINQESPEKRMYRLEAISTRLAYHKGVIKNPGAFWNLSQETLNEKENVLWAELIELFKKTYSKEQVAIEDIRHTVDIISKLFLSKAENKKRVKELNLLFSQRNRKEGE